MHEADVAYSEDHARGAQFYPSCVQFEISGSGTTIPTQDFIFNGGYTDKTPGIVFDIYADKPAVRARAEGYTIPGPDVWAEAGANSSAVVGGRAASVRIRGRQIKRA